MYTSTVHERCIAIRRRKISALLLAGAAERIVVRLRTCTETFEINLF